MSEEELLIETVGLVRILRSTAPAPAMRSASACGSALPPRFRRQTVIAIPARWSSPATVTCFSVGGDIREFGRFSSSYEATLENQRVWRLMPFLTIPIIAAVEGLALGAVPNWRCTPISSLRETPRNSASRRSPWAFFLGMAARSASRASSQATGDALSADRRKVHGRTGALDGSRQRGRSRCCALDRASELAARIADLPPLAVRRIKDVVLNGADLPLAPALALERNGYLTLQQTADHAGSGARLLGEAHAAV